MLGKFNAFDLSVPIINLFVASFLIAKQYVQLNGLKSVEYYATSGVLQISNLGPLLLNLFINNIGDVIHCKRSNARG